MYDTWKEAWPFYKHGLRARKAQSGFNEQIFTLKLTNSETPRQADCQLKWSHIARDLTVISFHVKCGLELIDSV